MLSNRKGILNNLEWTGGEGGGREGTSVVDSCWYLAANHRILQSNYPSIKEKYTKSD